MKRTWTVLKANALLTSRLQSLVLPSGADRPRWTSAQRRAAPHVIGTKSAQVGPLQEQVGKPVQAEAGGEGADEAVETS